MTITCDCSVDLGFERASCQTYRVWRARKTHTCCECGETIAPGQQYEHYTGYHFDGWQSYDTCLPCMRIRDHYCPNGWIFGSLAETIEPCIGFDYRELPDGDGGSFDGDVPLRNGVR